MWSRYPATPGRTTAVKGLLAPPITLGQLEAMRSPRTARSPANVAGGPQAVARPPRAARRWASTRRAALLCDLIGGVGRQQLAGGAVTRRDCLFVRLGGRLRGAGATGAGTGGERQPRSTGRAWPEGPLQHPARPRVRSPGVLSRSIRPLAALGPPAMAPSSPQPHRWRPWPPDGRAAIRRARPPCAATAGRPPHVSVSWEPRPDDVPRGARPRPVPGACRPVAACRSAPSGSRLGRRYGAR
jgi:hypothetical protein